MTTLPTKAQIDQAESLSFDRQVTPIALATFSYRGVLVQVDPMRLTDAALRSIEQRIARLLERESWSVPPTPQAAQPVRKPRQERVEPIYQPDGTACCPKHHKPLKDGRWGLYCPAKDETTERGYCALKFTE